MLCRLVIVCRSCASPTAHIYPAPVGGRGFVFERFLCLFISLSATLRENGWTDLHEIFREGVEWPWGDLIQFWINSGKWVGGSKVKLFVITGHSSESVAFAKWQQRTGVNKSVAFARRRGLLCPAPQLAIFVNLVTFSLLYQWLTVGPEQSFSRLKLVKNYLRNTMSWEQLSEVAVLFLWKMSTPENLMC